MTTTHYSEDDLILLFYGELGEGRQRQVMLAHVDECAACGALYRDIASTLSLVPAPPIPERGERYGLEVWQRVRPVLPSRPPGYSLWQINRFAIGGAIAASLVAAFLVGRMLPSRDGAPALNPSASVAVVGADSVDRVRFAAIGDHLEQSERLLLDFVNAGGQVVDVSGEQTMAAELIDTNRLYREAADGAGDTVVAEVLDALERSLIEIAHGPSKLSASEFNRMRMRLDAANLLFRVRVLSEEMHEREMSVTKPFKKDA
jgi:hypothetical protein